MFSIGDSADRARRQGLYRRGSGLPSARLWIGQQVLLVLPTSPWLRFLRRSSLSGGSRKSRVRFPSNQIALRQTATGANHLLPGSSPIFPVTRVSLFYRHCLFLGTSGRTHWP